MFSIYEVFIMSFASIQNNKLTNIQVSQLRSLNQVFDYVVDVYSTSFGFTVQISEYSNNSNIFALVTQKNEKRYFKSLDSVYNLFLTIHQNKAITFKINIHLI
jgi:hypothetical protein